MPLFLVQGGAPAARTEELPVPHKYRRSLSHQAADKQLNLFGLPGAKHSILEFEWQQLPEEIRGTVTGLMIKRRCTASAKNSKPRSVWMRWIGNGISSGRRSRKLSVLVALRRGYRPITFHRERSSMAVYW
jgi:hypothetical protein